MFEDSPENLLYLTAGAFAAGWLVAKISAYFARRLETPEQDPRDGKIRSLQAELRVARIDKVRADSAQEASDTELRDLRARLEEQERTVTDQLSQISKLRRDLRDSVRKTDELRNELSDRAEENLRSTMKLHQVETELSVVRASCDMLSTGVLDYNVDDDDDSETTRPANSSA